MKHDLTLFLSIDFLSTFFSNFKLVLVINWINKNSLSFCCIFLLNIIHHFIFYQHLGWKLLNRKVDINWMCMIFGKKTVMIQRLLVLILSYLSSFYNSVSIHMNQKDQYKSDIVVKKLVYQLQAFWTNLHTWWIKMRFMQSLDSKICNKWS